MFKTYKSPNFGDRRDGAKPSLIILHYTGMQTSGVALDRLCDKTSEVSAHDFIDEDGKILHLVKESKRAWHAGKSSWRGQADINSHSIGIEIVNPGHEFGYREFTVKQIEAVEKRCRKLMKKYDIKPENILGHSDIAPCRKQDPGELFPWQALAAEGIGVWPDPNEMDLQAAPALVEDEMLFHEMLIRYGYDPEASFAETITAFHRHFYPEKFKGQPEKPDDTSAARLLALLRAYPAE
jgi:N-acetylmuramoyl-L-alanine amidase